MPAARDIPPSSCAGMAVRRTASLRSTYDLRIHVVPTAQKDADGRVKPGHDELSKCRP
jgi:hypothetical protein